MRDFSISIGKADEEFCEGFEIRIQKIREIRARIGYTVLGHEVDEEDWMLYDDMLNHEYNHMMALLTLLDEKAG